MAKSNLLSFNSINRSDLRRLLLLGLGSSALLLLVAVLVAVRTAREIDRNVQTFSNQEMLAKDAIDDIQSQQIKLNNRWVQLARRKDFVRREEILDQLSESRQQMSSALEAAYGRAANLRESLSEESHGLLRWTAWLFAACIGLSFVCATWAVRATAGLFSKLQQQASDLSRLQYQFIETQEETARRFSHELHDELGQVMTAAKANLAALREAKDPARMPALIDDCMVLVDRAITDVREMSQLLRPTVLDDFGLDPALRSLAESFSQRTAIQVEYRSELDSQRLRDTTETNLYRIAQEALTNIARHSKASKVTLNLATKGREVALVIRDNGQGLTKDAQRAGGGLGLAGMETRARGSGGRLQLNSTPGKGLQIEVTCPIG